MLNSRRRCSKQTGKDRPAHSLVAGWVWGGDRLGRPRVDPGRPMGFDGFPLEKMLSKPRRRPMCTSRVASSLEVQGPGPIAASGRGACLPCMLRPQGPVAPPLGSSEAAPKKPLVFSLPGKKPVVGNPLRVLLSEKNLYVFGYFTGFPGARARKTGGKKKLYVV